MSPAGCSLRLEAPRVSPARLEITSARLTLQASSATVTLSDTSPGLQVLADVGPAGSEGLSALPNPKRWVVADWSSPRVLTGVRLDAVAQDADPKPVCGRLKISDGGPWYPTTPKEMIQINADETLPGLTASRLMIEVIQSTDSTPSKARLSALSLTFADQPGDISLAIQGRSPIFQRNGQLLPGEVVTIEEGLAEALTRALPPDGADGTLELTLRAQSPGSVVVTAAKIVAVHAFSALDPPSADRLALPWDGPARGTVTIGKNAGLADFRVRLIPELIAETVAVAMTPKAKAQRRFQLADPRRAVAQSIPPLGAPMAGADILVWPRSPRVVAQLDICPDSRGRPAPAPFHGAGIELIVDEQPGDAPRWIRAQLVRPLKLPDAPCWIVLRVVEGELYCALTECPADAEPPWSPAMHRVDDGGWLSRDILVRTKKPASMALAARVRCLATPPPVTLSIALIRGQKKLQLDADAEGHVEAESGALTDLNSAADAVLTLEVEATPPSGCDRSGEVALEDLRIRTSPSSPSTRAARTARKAQAQKKARRTKKQ